MRLAVAALVLLGLGTLAFIELGTHSSDAPPVERRSPESSEIRQVRSTRGVKARRYDPAGAIARDRVEASPPEGAEPGKDAAIVRLEEMRDEFAAEGFEDAAARVEMRIKQLRDDPQSIPASTLAPGP